MNISSLREFIVSAPACHEADSLLHLWQCFQRLQIDRLMVVNDQHSPIGLLRLSRLISVFDFETSEVQTLADHLSLVDPILCYPVDGDGVQLKPRFAEMGQPPVVLVDTAGQYVGLLDDVQFLKAWATEASISKSRSRSIKHQKAEAVSQALPGPLIDLLERLPLPLMLQTSAGRVITQNQAWRQRVGAIQNPQRVRRAAARILEVALARKAHERKRSTGSNANRGASAPDVLGLSAISNTPELQAGVCHLGPEPNTCVCVCPMKNGQDRVWQFIKVPMGSLPNSPWSDWEIDKADAQDAQSPTPRPFKLASLKFNPDPEWRLLVETETLWLVLAQDMTEQQQVAKELAARNADLVQLNRLKDEFLACISHELKTPLTAVLGMSSLLKDQLLGDLNERQFHYAQLIYRSGRHLIAIINNILDLTRIETNQLELLVEQVHIPSICQYAYEHAQQQQMVESSAEEETLALQSQRQFHLDIQPGLQYMQADELRLRQMLTNLLSNAIKFTQPEDEIGLQVEDWEGWIAFTVWDQGIGIPADKQHLIFQKFQQLENPLTRQFHGTGLGLVLTQRLARLHGGDVSFTSIPGGGSRFTLLLPPVPPQGSDLNPTAKLPHQSPATAKSPALSKSSAFKPNASFKAQNSSTVTERNRLILLMEAEARHLEERLDQLTELGYRAVIARSGTEAIEKARRLQPAAILLNPRLPLLSGWDVLTLLKADESTREIPIVITSIRVDRDQAYRNGADNFLSLPIDPGSLQYCLDQLIHPIEPELTDAIVDLTVLHLYEGNPSFTLISSQSIDQGLNRLLYPYHCRVLEVDDLDQADLLARVWKPDVVLIDRIQTDPEQFMQQLSQAPYLVNLPLITVTAEITQAANQISGLAVFPYLATIATADPSNQPDVLELVQVIQLAAGIHWIPQIVIVDCASIDPQITISDVRPPMQALVQYLQTAGFRSTVCNDWQKLQQKLQHPGVDLLLLCITGTESVQMLDQVSHLLHQIAHRPLTLIWHYHSAATEQADSTLALAKLQTIAADSLTASDSILDLLARIKQLLSVRRSL